MDYVFVKFPIVIYPSEDDEGGRYTAHCLNMDLVADDDCAEGVISKLLETIEVSLQAAKEHKASVFRDAPREYWMKLAGAHEIPRELKERIVFRVNKRCGHAVDVESQCELRATRELEFA